MNREAISLAGLENVSSTRPTELSPRGETPVPRPFLHISEPLNKKDECAEPKAKEQSEGARPEGAQALSTTKGRAKASPPDLSLRRRQPKRAMVFGTCGFL